ncbi:MAG: thioredoxin family protein, partial [Gemmatimonadaceae bacterium]
VSLAFVLSAGSRLRARLTRAGRGESIIRQGLGIATLVTVTAIFFGWDSALFARLGVVQTASAEESLVRRLTGAATARPDAGMSLEEFAAGNAAALLPEEAGVLQPFAGATEWINSPPITLESLRGKVVLIQFWTFACYNCLNALPYVKKLEAKYRDKGLVVVSVHTPELPRERVLANVRREVKELGITYPVVVDNDFKIWNAYKNHYWPAAYYADATGKLRFHHFGEGRYEEQDKVVAKLLAEAAAYRAVR